MILLKHTVTTNDTLFSICEEYSISIDQLISSNILKYPKLKDNPFMIFSGWELDIPLINNGGDTQYNVFRG